VFSFVACCHKVAWVYTVDRYLTKYDCVTFITLVNSLRSTDYAMKSSGWLLLDSAETLFVVSKQRVFGTQTKKENDNSSGL
jgi:DNA excision repair protein ERCC-4